MGRKNSDDIYKEIQALKGQMAAEHRASTHTFVAMLQRYTKDIVNEVGVAVKKLAKNIADASAKNEAATRDEGQKTRDHVTAEADKTRDHVTKESKKTRQAIWDATDTPVLIPFLIALIVGLLVFVLFMGYVKKDAQAAISSPETTTSWFVDSNAAVDHTEYTYSEDGEKVESSTQVLKYSPEKNMKYYFIPPLVAIVSFAIVFLLAFLAASRLNRR